VADFDFDYWRRVAEQDPESYFRARHGAIERFIGSHSPAEAQRLRSLQAHIDCARAAAGTPVHALLAVSRMIETNLIALCEQGAALREATRRLDALVAHLQGVERIR